MIVQRTLYRMHLGNSPKEIVDFTKTTCDGLGYPHGHRVLTSSLGPGQTMIIEAKYESLAQMERHWAGFTLSHDFWDRYNALLEGTVSSEVWTLDVKGEARRVLSPPANTLPIHEMNLVAGLSVPSPPAPCLPVARASTHRASPLHSPSITSLEALV